MNTLSLDSSFLKSCCASFYGQGWLSALLGEVWHPGGTGLTERLGHILRLVPGEIVLDMASGTGASSVTLAERFGCKVLGVDISYADSFSSRKAWRESRVPDALGPVCGDCEALPLMDRSVQVVVCECSLCLFPNKAAALREAYRVLEPGGRLGIADLTVEEDPLPPALQGLESYVLCIGSALPQDRYIQLARDAGFEDIQIEDHRDALARLIKDIQGILSFVAIGKALGRLEISEEKLAWAREALHAAGDMVAHGRAGYILLTARKPLHP